jgi:hypothetical protein
MVLYCPTAVSNSNVLISTKSLPPQRILLVSGTKCQRGHEGAVLGEVRRRPQLVEKVGTEPKATTNRARNAPKAVCLVADHGRKRAPREFFNTLADYKKFASVVALLHRCGAFDYISGET